MGASSGSRTDVMVRQFLSRVKGQAKAGVSWLSFKSQQLDGSLTVDFVFAP